MPASAAVTFSALMSQTSVLRRPESRATSRIASRSIPIPATDHITCAMPIANAYSPSSRAERPRQGDQQHEAGQAREHFRADAEPDVAQQAGVRAAHRSSSSYTA